MEISDTGDPSEAERRVMARRSNAERRFAERRAPERAQAGRRVLFVPDRRTDERRGLSPQLAV